MSLFIGTSSSLQSPVASTPSAILLDDYTSCVAVVCSPQSPQHQRKLAEERLSQINKEISFWEKSLPFFSQADDTLLFFLAQGLSKYCWRSWSQSPNHFQNTIAQTVLNTLSLRSATLSQYSRSKLEQLLATLCLVSVSMEPVMMILPGGALSSNNQGNLVVGLSALRTVFEDILSNNPRVTPANQAILVSSVTTVAVTATILCCQSLATAASTSSAVSETSETVVIMSLELLKTIIGKLPVGSHLTPDVLSLLFSVAEGAISYVPVSAVSAVEALTELMAKRFLPRSGGGGGDAGADVLVELVGRAVALLRRYRPAMAAAAAAVAVAEAAGGTSAMEMPVVLPLLEFLSIFAESHLERCLASPSGSMASSVGEFLIELTGITTASTDPQTLLKAVSVWESVLAVENIGSFVVSKAQEVSIPIAHHVILNCLAHLNAQLAESIDELEEELPTQPFVDPHIRALVDHIYAGNSNSNSNTNGSSGSGGVGKSESIKNGNNGGGGGGGGGGIVDGADDSSFVGTALRASCQRLMVSLCTDSSGTSNPDLIAWMSASIPPLAQQCIGAINSEKGNLVAVDLCLLLRLLPMCVPRAELCVQLSGLVSHLTETRAHARGPAFCALLLVACQVLGQLLMASQGAIISAVKGSGGYGGGGGGGGGDEVGAVLRCLPLITQSVIHACDTMVSPNPLSVTGATAALLLQALHAATPSLLHGHPSSTLSPSLSPSLSLSSNNIAADLSTQIHVLFPRLTHLSMEVQALLVCCSDRLLPSYIAGQCTQQLLEMSAVAENTASWEDISRISLLCRLSVSLDALARDYATDIPAERGRVCGCLEPLCNGPLYKLMRGGVKALQQILEQSTSPSPSTSSSPSQGLKGSIINALRLLVSLSSGMLQALGKKTFGGQANDTLQICANFVGSGDITGLFWTRMLIDGSGLSLMKEMLQLVRCIGDSSSSISQHAAQQASFSHDILVAVARALSDQRVCVELLQDALSTGSVVIQSYWQSHGQGQSGDGGQSGGGGARGVNVQPTIELMLQMCVGSMDPSVPPQDALVAIEGITTLARKHSLFSLPWFQEKGCWHSLLRATLRAVLVRAHTMHADAISALLVLLSQADVSLITSSSTGSAGGNGSNGGSIWAVIGREVVELTAEVGCNPQLAESVLSSLSQQYPDLKNLDMNIFVAKVLVPISADVARISE